MAQLPVASDVEVHSVDVCLYHWAVYMCAASQLTDCNGSWRIKIHVSHSSMCCIQFAACCHSREALVHCLVVVVANADPCR